MKSINQITSQMEFEGWKKHNPNRWSFLVNDPKESFRLHIWLYEDQWYLGTTNDRMPMPTLEQAYTAAVAIIAERKN